jgi:hypothetical protein
VEQLGAGIAAVQNVVGPAAEGSASDPWRRAPESQSPGDIESPAYPACRVDEQYPRFAMRDSSRQEGKPVLGEVAVIGQGVGDARLLTSLFLGHAPCHDYAPAIVNVASRVSSSPSTSSPSS